MENYSSYPLIGYFFFTYNLCESTKVKSDYVDSKHDIDDFKIKIKIAIEFQLVFCNFKTSKKINAIKVYYF